MHKVTKYLICTAMSLCLFVAIEAHATDFRSPEIKVFDSVNGSLKKSFMGYDSAFRGGARITRGDFNGDGYGDIAVGAGPGGGPHVRIFNKDGQYVGWDIFPFHPDFRGGVEVAAGDMDGDGKDELIVGQYRYGQAWVKIYKVDGSKRVVNQFLAYNEGFEGGVRLASGDIDGDGIDEIITGAGPGGGPHIRAFEADGTEIENFFPFHPDFRGGVDVAVGDVDLDGRDEIISSQNSFGQAWVKVYKVNASKDVLGQFIAFNTDYEGGANVSATDINGDYRADIIVGAAELGGPQIRTFTYQGTLLPMSVMAYEDEFRGGVDVAGGDTDRGNTTEIITSPQRIQAESAKYPYSRYMEVDISDQTLKYFENGRKIGEMLTSTGLSFPTPIGTFDVYSKIRSATMAGYYGPGSRLNYNLPGVPYILKFSGPYTIHGAYWHNNFGHPMSHGCVNLSVHNSEILYTWARVGDKVIIHQ